MHDLAISAFPAAEARAPTEREVDMERLVIAAVALVAAVGAASCGEEGTTTGTLAAASVATTLEEQLGASIFFDENLSIDQNQSCASCHGPAVGWTGPLSNINAAGAVYEGSIPGRFGNRKPPSSGYATLSPIFHLEKRGLFVGGNFWDGRATGEKLGNPAADQAQGPFLNPVEQGLPDNACVVYRVCNPVMSDDYPVGFEQVWGAGTCAIDWPADIDQSCATEGARVSLSDADRAKVDANYDRIALSIETYEGSSEVNAFTSKYDAFLAKAADLTRQERRGLSIFKGKGKCNKCHVLGKGPKDPALFTDFTFDNLGVPRNPDNPWYDQSDFNPDGFDWVDEGLGGFLETRSEYAAYAEDNMGKQKVPTLRNVDKRPSPDFVKAYTHNGYFKSLWQVVHFYNTRDVKPTCADPFTTVEDALAQKCWPEPEVDENVNTSELGDLRLSTEEEEALVAFLTTLSDGFTAPATQ
jgi:cytochrome c peroxidase